MNSNMTALREGERGSALSDLAVEAAITDRSGGLELSDAERVARLVESGSSRLTAERIVAIERGTADPGRARRHTPTRS
jgi:CelD/BcsL family acetyltransferase involved in cellulose biosynthesis